MEINLKYLIILTAFIVLACEEIQDENNTAFNEKGQLYEREHSNGNGEIRVDTVFEELVSGLVNFKEQKDGLYYGSLLLKSANFEIVDTVQNNYEGFAFYVDFKSKEHNLPGSGEYAFASGSENVILNGVVLLNGDLVPLVSGTMSVNQQYPNFDISFNGYDNNNKHVVVNYEGTLALEIEDEAYVNTKVEGYVELGSEGQLAINELQIEILETNFNDVENISSQQLTFTFSNTRKLEIKVLVTENNLLIPGTYIRSTLDQIFSSDELFLAQNIIYDIKIDLNDGNIGTINEENYFTMEVEILESGDEYVISFEADPVEPSGEHIKLYFKGSVKQ